MLEPFGVRLHDTGTGIDVTLSAGLSHWPIVDGGDVLLGTAYGLLLEGWMGQGLSLRNGTIRVAGAIADATAFEKRVIDGLHGLIVVRTTPGGVFGNRLYPDGGASVPIVYCAELRRAGGSADQILDDDAYNRRFLGLRHQRLVVREGHGWITGTQTAHRGVERLLPNHYLDLDSFSAHRFWPRPDDFREPMPFETAAASVAHDIQGFVAAAARQFQPAIMLTAGFDSRIIAAAAQPVLRDVAFATVDAPSAGIDQVMSASIAQKFGLEHRAIPLVCASEPEQDLWDRRVGHAVRERNRVTHPSLGQIERNVILTGIYGEPGRARLYRHDVATINDAAATPDFVMSRLGLPIDPEQRDNVARWLAPLGWLPRSAVLDLAYCELKGGSWAMAQGPAQKAVKLSMMPFAQRRIQHAFMAVAPGEKGTATLFRRIGDMLWPAMMNVPVNRYGDYRDQLGSFCKMFDRRRWTRQLRSRLA